MRVAGIGIGAKLREPQELSLVRYLLKRLRKKPGSSALHLTSLRPALQIRARHDSPGNCSGCGPAQEPGRPCSPTVSRDPGVIGLSRPCDCLGRSKTRETYKPRHIQASAHTRGLPCEAPLSRSHASALSSPKEALVPISSCRMGQTDPFPAPIPCRLRTNARLLEITWCCCGFVAGV